MFNSVKFAVHPEKVTMIHFSRDNFVFSTIKQQLRLLDCFLKIFGLASLDLPTPFFVANYIYPLFIIAILLYTSICSLKQFHEGEYTKVSPVTLIANHLQLLSLSMASCVSVICSIVRYKKYDTAVEELIQIDNILIHKLSIDVTKDNLHSNRCLFISFLSSCVLIILDYIVLIYNGPKYYFDYVITFHISFLIILLADCRILIVFKLLAHRFKYINNFLKISKQDKTAGTQILSTIKYYTFTKRKIKELANVHSWLIKTTENLNSYFSPSLLVEIAAYFTISTCNIYTFFYVLTDANLKHYHRMIVYYTAYWPIVIVLKLCFLLKSSGNVTEQTNLTSNLVHKILINGEFPEVQKELDIFALQLMYKKLQINVCGFFPLDFSLLYAMISASTTYLIILIQFQISTEH